MYTSTKFFKEIGPCAYRNWKSQTDCYMLHGYCRSLKFVFGADVLDRQNFVVDFGGLKEVKRQFEDWFDHSVILQADDPLVNSFRILESKGHCKLRTFPIISCEGLAQYVAEYMDHFIRNATNNRAWVVSCEMMEAEKNSALYTIKPNDPDRITWDDLYQLNKDMEESADKVSFEGL